MKTKTIIPGRQGDVLLVKINALPKDAKKKKRENGRVILAHGEATGHHHSFTEPHCALYTSKAETGVTFLEVRDAMAALTHQEHGAIEIEPGVYRVIRQREYSPEAIRNVQD